MLHQTIIIYLILINLIAYAMMWIDKAKAIKKQERISERSLFLIALVCGALGIYGGMKIPLYHKAAKAKFKIGIPIILVFNFFAVYYVYQFLLHLMDK